MPAGAFLPRELVLALFLAGAVEAGLFGLFLVAGENRTQLVAHEAEIPEEVPIAVKPVLDDLPLLKLGGKRMLAKLPDMWSKRAAVQRFEEKSAPSAKAEKTPQAIPSTPVASKSAEAPPPDAALAKEVDQKLADAAPQKEQASSATEGAADGVKQGTETDPLKARAANLYAAKLIGWFQIRFQRPTGLPCSVVHALSAGAQIAVGADRTIERFTFSRPSGNADFDAKVKASLDAVVGQELPPPPPLYPDLKPNAVLTPTFSGKDAPCAE